MVEPYTEARTEQGSGAQESRTVVEHTTPLWRLLGVVLAFGALGLVGWWLSQVGHVDDAATLLTIVLVYTVGFWARRQKLRLAERLGPFGQVGVAIIESQQEIARWVDQRTLLAGVLVATGYGVAVLLIRAAVSVVLGWFASPWLAAAVGCAVGAAVVAPDLWRVVGRKISGRS